MATQERKEEGGGGGGIGTHILYVRYIILLRKEGRQSRERRKSHRKKDEGLRERWAEERQTTTHIH